MKRITLLLIIFTFFSIHQEGVQEAYSAVLLDRVVATVNDEVITWSELMSVVLLEGKDYIGGESGEVRNERIKDLEKPFLDNLIEMKLQLQEARKMGLGVSESEVDGAINDIKKKYNITEENLMNSLKAEGLTNEDYRTRLADQILLQKVVNSAVKMNIVIPDGEIEEYYEKNKDRYTEKERLKIRQIFFRLPEDESDMPSVEEKAQDVLRRISNGEDFAELAREFSEGPGREFGGDLGYISRGSVLKEIEDAAFALKVGEVSKVFRSSAGLHIIKLEEKTGGGGIEKAREQIKEILFKRAYELQYHEWITGLKEKAYIDKKL